MYNNKNLKFKSAACNVIMSYNLTIYAFQLIYRAVVEWIVSATKTVDSGSIPTRVNQC